MKYRVLYGLRSNKLAFFALAVIAVFTCMAILPTLFVNKLPWTIVVEKQLQSPSWQHLLGTDKIGRDVWACVVYGARTTFAVLTLSIVISVPLGIFLGMFAGYWGGAVRRVVMRLTDVFLSFPRLVLAMMVPALFGNNGWITIVVALSFTVWPYYTRLACVETMNVKDMAFVHIACMQGAKFGYLLRKHILPFLIPSAVVRLTNDGSMIVLTAASLGFLGLGISPDIPEWGSLAAQGSPFLFTHAWVGLAPCMAIFLLSFSFHVIGDVLRDAFDPKQK